MTFVGLAALLQSTWGQPDFGKLPEFLSTEKARITDIFVIDQLDKRVGNADYKNNLVIMPDYEGYGLTAGR